jgi:hypothetical protein
LYVIVLKKLPTAVGLSLIFVGLIVASSYNSPATEESWETAAENTGNWSITGTFNSGENITLIIAWYGMTYGEDLGELPANVTITANNQDITEFQVFFLQDPNTPTGQEQVQVYVSRIQLLYNNGDSLSVDNPPKQIGGIVKQAGTFEARVHPPPDSFPWAGYPEPQPPTALKLLKMVAKMTYPYRSFLPIGVAAGFLGAIVSTWGAKAKKNVRRTRSKRKK